MQDVAITPSAEHTMSTVAHPSPPVKRQSSTERVASYRRRMMSTPEGAQKIKELNRCNNRKLYQRVKSTIEGLLREIETYETILLVKGLDTRGVKLTEEEKMQQEDESPSKKASKKYFPPKELGPMNKQELSEWRKAQRIERERRRKAQQRTQTKKRIRLLEGRLAFLKRMAHCPLATSVEPKHFVQWLDCVQFEPAAVADQTCKVNVEPVVGFDPVDEATKAIMNEPLHDF